MQGSTVVLYTTVNTITGNGNPNSRVCKLFKGSPTVYTLANMYIYAFQQVVQCVCTTGIQYSTAYAKMVG